MTIKIFEINDIEWWAGDCTPEEMLAFYMNETGVTHEEATGDDSEFPRALSDHEMDNMKFFDEENSERRTFRQELERMIQSNQVFPSSFATTEF